MKPPTIHTGRSQLDVRDGSNSSFASDYNDDDDQGKVVFAKAIDSTNFLGKTWNQNWFKICDFYQFSFFFFQKMIFPTKHCNLNGF